MNGVLGPDEFPNYDVFEWFWMLVFFKLLAALAVIIRGLLPSPTFTRKNGCSVAGCHSRGRHGPRLWSLLHWYIRCPPSLPSAIGKSGEEATETKSSETVNCLESRGPDLDARQSRCDNLVRGSLR